MQVNNSDGNHHHEQDKDNGILCTLAVCIFKTCTVI